MSAEHGEQQRQTPNKAVKGLEEAFELVDPCDWGRPRSEYARRRAQTRANQKRTKRRRAKGGLSCCEQVGLQDAYLGTQLLLENSAADRLFAHRMQSMATLVGELASEQTTLLRSLHGLDRLEVKAQMLDHFCLELCMVAAGAVLYGPPTHRAVLKGALHRLYRLSGSTALERYPALLLRYAMGVAAIIAEDEEAVRELVSGAMYMNFGNMQIEVEFDLYGALRNCAWLVETDGWHEHVQTWLQPILTILTGASPAEVRRATMRFELLYYLPKIYVQKSATFKAMENFCAVYSSKAKETALLIDDLRERGTGFLEYFDSKRHGEVALNVLARIFEERTRASQASAVSDSNAFIPKPAGTVDPSEERA